MYLVKQVLFRLSAIEANTHAGFILAAEMLLGRAYGVIENGHGPPEALLRRP